MLGINSSLCSLENMTVNGQSLGMGLSGVTDYSSQLPFLDLFKTARPWIPQSNSTWDTQEASLLDLDADGWVRSLPATQNQTSPPRYTRVGTLMLRDIPNAYPPGRYVVLYEGTGTMSYGFAARKLDELSTSGRDVIEVNSSGDGLYVQITETDPQQTGDYLRNIRVYREADLPLVELGLTFNPEFLQKIQTFGSLRFMDWMRTNGSQQQTWDQRPTAQDAVWSTERGVPVEVMVELANQTGVSPWFNMPHQATDEYIRQFAEYVRDHLDPKLTVYVEFSNEVWNWMFPQTQYADQQSRARWGNVEGGWLQWYGMRTAEMSQIWKTTFGNQSNRVRSVLSTQTGWRGLENYLLDTPAWVQEGHAPAYTYVDAYAITGYFSGGLGLANNAEVVKSWLADPDGGFAKAFQQLRDGGLLPDRDSLVDTIANFNYHSAIAQARDLQLVAYEGGQHIVNYGTIANTSTDDEILTQFFIALNRRPEMQQLYEELLEGWKAAGGTLFSHFVDVGLPSRYGSWGALETLFQTTSPKYAALMDFIDRYDRWWAESDTRTQLGLIQRGQATSEILSGSPDDDILLGGAGDDQISGSSGQDRLHGEAGNDQIWGGAGHDRILGGAGEDSLQGQSGDDTLGGGAGNDILNGGIGRDSYLFSSWGAFATADFGIDRIGFEAGLDRLIFDPKSFTSGTTLALIGTDAEAATRSEPILYSVTTGRLFYNANGSAMGLGSGGQFAQLTTRPLLPAAELTSPTGNPNGSSSDQTLAGTDLNDVLIGGQGNDSLAGQAGNDTLIGRDGNDRLNGGSGRDRLTGQLGADRFLFIGSSQSAALATSTISALDTITDFDPLGGDRIHLDWDGDLDTGETVTSLFNAGVMPQSTLSTAARAAFADKNHETPVAEALQPGEAVIFRWNAKVYVAINDSQLGFSNRDGMVNVTGLNQPTADLTSGVLSVADYFAVPI